jgi:thiol:disulfide interchange protein DsbD
MLPLLSYGQGLSSEAGPSSAAHGDVEWRVEEQPPVVRTGERLMVRFRGRVTDGWHTYALNSPAGKPLEITFDSLPPELTVERPLRQSEPTAQYDPNFKSQARYLNGQFEVRAALTVGAEAPLGPDTLHASVRYMVCNDQLCMPPQTASLAVPITIAEGDVRDAFGQARFGELVLPDSASGADAATAVAEADTTTAVAGTVGEQRAQGLWGLLLLAAGAGLGALFMPCLFPMIPLTVSYFTKHADGTGETLRLTGAYGLTIIAAFTGLGAFAAAFLGASGAQVVAANPWVNLAIGGTLVAFALSLLGLYELRLPSGLLNALNRSSNAYGGYVGVVFMALTLTVVSFSCTAPFVGGLLAAAAQGTWVDPVVGMLVFSTVVALPFVGFALFPSGLQQLPTSGHWMHTLKVTFGFVELVAALKFFSNADLVWGTGLLSRSLLLAFAVVLLGLAGLHLLGKLPLRTSGASPARGEDAAGGPVQIGVGRLFAATLFLGSALYMAPGLWGASLGSLDAYLPPRDASTRLMETAPEGASPPVSQLDWNADDIDAAVADAQTAGQPLFVDFSGYTCTNCREMEMNVFPEPVVAAHLRDDLALLRLHTDDADQGPALRRFQRELTGTVALPTYAIITPDEQVLAQHQGMASPEAFDEFLERGIDAARSGEAERES